MAKGEQPKINPKDFGFDDTAWKKIDANIRNWIVLNKELWKGLSQYEKDALKTSKEFKKTSKEASESAKEVFSLANELGKSFQDSGKSAKFITQTMGVMENIKKNIFAIDTKTDKVSQKQMKSINGALDISQDYLHNREAIGTDEFRSLDFNNKIREAIKAKLPLVAEHLQMLKMEHDKQKILNAEINKQSDLIKKPFQAIDDVINRIPMVGELLSAKFDLKGKADKVADGFITAAKAAIKLEEAEEGPTKKGGGLDMRFTKNKEIARLEKESLGNIGKMGPAFLLVGAAVAGLATAMFNFSKDLGVSFSKVNPLLLLFKEETKAILDEFGSIDDVSFDMVLNMKKAAFFSGVMPADMAKVAMLQTTITGQTKEMALDRQAKFMSDIKKEGLSASKVMGDLAANADMFANFAKDGGKNMEEAAKQAARMGLDLSATNAVAESLLDFESSINSEMELAMLTGRNINLDRARQLAFTGDLAQMMTEVKNQAGGEAAFSAMNVVQRQALGTAIGLQGAQLAEFMKTEEERTKALNQGLWMKMGLFAGIATVIGTIIGAIVVGIKGMKGIADLKAGALTGGKIGAGAGIAGAATYGLVSAQARASGGPVTAGNPYIVGEKRPELFIPTQSGHILPNVPRMQDGSGATFSSVESNKMIDAFYAVGKSINETSEKLAKISDSKRQALYNNY